MGLCFASPYYYNRRSNMYPQQAYGGGYGGGMGGGGMMGGGMMGGGMMGNQTTVGMDQYGDRVVDQRNMMTGRETEVIQDRFGDREVIQRDGFGDTTVSYQPGMMGGGMMGGGMDGPRMLI